MRRMLLAQRCLKAGVHSSLRFGLFHITYQAHHLYVYEQFEGA